MRVINVFVDTSIVNRILEIDKSTVRHTIYEEDRLYISKIIGYVKKGIVRLIVNPSVKHEIENATDPKRKRELLALFDQFHFTPYNKWIFPIVFPVHFVTKEEKVVLGELRKKIKGFRKDAKIFLDAAANSQVEILLTTDRQHLACIELRDYIADKKLDTEIKIFTPKELYEYLKRLGL